MLDIEREGGEERQKGGKKLLRRVEKERERGSERERVRERES